MIHDEGAGMGIRVNVNNDALFKVVCTEGKQDDRTQHMSPLCHVYFYLTLTSHSIAIVVVAHTHVFSLFDFECHI